MNGVGAGAPSTAVPGAGLPAEFYDRPVLEVAPELVGCVVSHGGTSGVIVEVEAYHQQEPACHAYVGLTRRTQVLFGPPGVAYVYRSYGIHALLNAVCEPEGTGAAVLIRALEPLSGLELMRERRAERARLGKPGLVAPRDRDLCSGPGKLTQALGIELGENATSLSSGPVRITPRPPAWSTPEVLVSTRVGITRATELPWRFSAGGNPNVSYPRPVAAGAGASSEPRRGAERASPAYS